MSLPVGSAAPPHEDIDDLRRRLVEAEETIEAIRSGAVDAFVVEDEGGQRIYTLQTADRPYRVLVETMQQGAATLSADGLVLFCNPRLATLLGRGRERLMGAAFEALVPPAQRDAIAELLRHGSLRVVEREFALLRDDGPTVPVLLTVSPLPAEAAAAICVLVTDLTEHQHYEELRLAQEALREADRRKDEFLATLAHELRNPLAPIRNALEVLVRQAEQDAPSQAMHELIKRQLAQMVRLIDDLLDVSRITLGKLQLRRQRVALSDVIEQAIETCRPNIESAGHHLTIDLPAGPIWVDADATRLAQVFANLLNNACKYTDAGGQLGVRAGRDECDSGPSWAWVSVQDNGIGIAPEFLPRLFDQFSQVEASAERSGGGLGVGLSLANSLIQMHGGSISAHSEGPGRGSTFVVRLPMALDARTAAPKVSHGAAAPATARRILVVDDNRDNTDSLALLLQMQGHEARTAYDGVDGVELADRWRPDVVLLDIGMPRCDGYDACRLIRSRPWGADTLLIAQTGWGREIDKRRASGVGFDAHLVKPVDCGQLADLVEALLARREAGRVGAVGNRVEGGTPLGELLGK